VLFDAVDEYLVLTNITNLQTLLNGSNAFTLSGWGKSEAAGYRSIFGTFALGTFKGVKIFQNGSGAGTFGIYMIRDYNAAGVIGKFTNAGGVGANVGYHYCVSYSAATQGLSDLKLYINGVDRTCNTEGANIGGDCTPPALNFGYANDGQGRWDGNLDEFAIYDRVLSAAEITTLADPSTDPSSISNCTNWWRFGDDPTDSIATSIKDQIGTSHATATNMESGDIVEDVAA
jgi:hypothetical protein